MARSRQAGPWAERPTFCKGWGAPGKTAHAGQGTSNFRAMVIWREAWSNRHTVGRATEVEAKGGLGAPQQGLARSQGWVGTWAGWGGGSFQVSPDGGCRPGVLGPSLGVRSPP